MDTGEKQREMTKRQGKLGRLVAAASLVVVSASTLSLMKEATELKLFFITRIPVTTNAQSEDAATNNATTVHPNNKSLPKWISNYMSWHGKMRRRYPGRQLFENPRAPKLLVRVCLRNCGGVNDRLGQLPWDLYLANQTQRLLLIYWLQPAHLQEFLVPNTLDWSVPPDIDWDYDELYYSTTWFFQDLPGSQRHPDKQFMDNNINAAIERANHGVFQNEKLLLFRFLGHIHEDTLESRLQALGEDDMIHYTGTFGRIFQAFFQPSPGVQASLDQMYTILNGSYSAVHLRVRHPKGAGSEGIWDGEGLPFNGKAKDLSVQTATHAVQCAKTLVASPKEPIYFFSDSSDLVQYMLHDLKQPHNNGSLIAQNDVDAAAQKVVASAWLVSRNVSGTTNLHIDKQFGNRVSDHYPSFVDLFVAAGARCLTYGLGYYSIFASKLSGTQCKLLYQEESWGAVANKTNHATLCTPDMYQHSS